MAVTRWAAISVFLVSSASLAFLLLYSSSDKEAATTPKNAPFSSVPVSDANLFRGTGQRPLGTQLTESVIKPHHDTYSDGRYLVYYQIPDDVKYLLIVLHGCDKDAKDWFRYPEQRQFVLEALDMKFAVVALNSPVRVDPKCWDNKFARDFSGVQHGDLYNNDVRITFTVLNEFLNRHPEVETLPKFGVGVASGGSFLTLLARQVRFQSIGLYVSPGTSYMFEDRMRQLTGNATTYITPFPPTIFLYMPRDTVYATMGEVTLAAMGLSEESVENRVVPLVPWPLTVDNLMVRNSKISEDCANAIVNTWRDGNTTAPYTLLDDNQYMEVNPKRLMKWANNMRKNRVCVEWSRRSPKHLTAILEAMYAKHSFTSDFSVDVLKWMLFHGQRET